MSGKRRDTIAALCHKYTAAVAYQGPHQQWMDRRAAIKASLDAFLHGPSKDTLGDLQGVLQGFLRDAEAGMAIPKALT